MYIPLILFFTSLLSIIVMIAKKLGAVPKEALMNNNEQFPIELPYLKEAKEKTVQNVKKHGYAALVIIIRWYVRGANLLKSKYETAKAKIENWKQSKNINGEKKEISKFLRVIGEYKQKIREIKHRISKEENL